jgi:Tfp pilus assembly protein PilN
MYLILFGMVMIALGGTFATIKVRQHAISVKEKAINARMAKASESIEQFEQLQQKRKEMMKTALTTAGLFEPVQRSILLAAITNNLPAGTSLLKLEINQEENKNRSSYSHIANTRKAKFEKAAEEDEFQAQLSPERLLETNIEIEGMAPSDLQVAAFIENLGCSPLFESVALVESKEEKNRDESKFRKFKLSTKLRSDIHLSNQEIDYIRSKTKSPSQQTINEPADQQQEL